MKAYKSILATLFIFLMVLLPSVLAWTSSEFTLDNAKQLEKNSLTTYGKYEIIEHQWWDIAKIFTEEKVKEVTLKENTDECSDNCFAIKEVTNLKPMPLIDDVRFYREIDGKWVLWDGFTNWKIEVEEDVDLFETQCIQGKEIIDEKNGTSYFEQECSQVKTGTEKRWLPLDYKKDYEGTYRVKLSGGKKPNVKYDWQVKMNGVWSEEWAVWGAVIGVGGVEASVTLNSPANNSIQYTKSVTVNASANVTSGAYLTNATLYDNSTGSWGARNTTAASVNKSNNSFVFDTTTSVTEYWGERITIGARNIYIVNVTKSGTSTATKAYLKWDNGTLITTATYSGNIATFSSPILLLANTQYRIEDGADGSTWIRHWKNGVTQNYLNNDITWNQASVNGVDFGTGYGMDILVIGYYTNISLTQTFTNTYSSGDVVDWNMKFCDSDGDCGFAPQNFTFSIDSGAPTITLNYPTSLIDYGKINGTLQLNFTATDSNLDKVWYNYNGTNVSITGAKTGIYNLSNITLSTKKNVTIYANDTAGNLNATTFSWDYLIFQNNQNYTTPAYETQLVTFSINLTYNTSSSLSAVLNYDGVNYSSINSGSGDNAIFTTNTFNIPLINGNVNKTFYWILNYNNSLILTEQINQTINSILITQCNGTYTVPSLNFTFYDELNQTIINGASTPTSFLFNIKYWLGDGSVYKNYSFQNLNSALNSYQFCISQNITYKADSDLQYYTSTHAERTYYLRNVSLTNTTQYIRLYNLLTTEATKFQINIKEGTNVLANALVNVQKYFVGINQWKTVLIGLTDDKGSFTANIDLDQKYNLSVTKDGTDYGSFEKSSICLASPCNIDLYLQDIVLNPYDPYYEYFAQNVDYNLTANDTTQTITLDFLDKTGTATYWRLWVYKTYYQNDSIFTICDEKTYSPSGSLTCNYTGNSGDLNAKVYISRSPEKLVTFLNWANSLDYKTFGASAILASIIIILVLFFTGIRNPVNALLLMPLALVILKFLQLMPFSWGWILGLTILDLWLISKLKT